MCTIVPLHGHIQQLPLQQDYITVVLIPGVFAHLILQGLQAGIL